MMDYWIIAQLSTPLPASEGSGDSETGLEFAAGDHGLQCMEERPADDDDDDDDDDDAESCSYDSYDRAQIENAADDGGESVGSRDDDDDDDDEAHGVDEEGVFVWLPANSRAKIKEEKEVKVVDSEDDDRMFWETCLATGF